MSDRAAARKNLAEELAEIRSLFDAKAFDDAERRLAVLTAKEVVPIQAFRLHSLALYRLGRRTDALRIVRNGLSVWPLDRQLSQVRVEAVRRGLGPEEANAELLKEAETDPDDAVLQCAIAQSWLAMGKLQQARSCIDRAACLASSDAQIALHRIVILAAVGDRESALRCMADANSSEAELLAIFDQTIRSLVRIRRTDLALTVSQAASDLLPQHAEPMVRTAEFLLGEKRAADALVQLDRWASPVESMDADIAFRFLSAQGKALHELGRREEALTTFERALGYKADDETILRELYVLSQKLGQDEKRRSYGRRLTGSGSKGLPPSLAEGLAGLREQKVPVPATERLRWAWELADKNKWNEADWLAAVSWGQAADRLLRSWWLNAHERSDQIDALIDRPKGAAVKQLLAASKCVCVTTHMGPLAATVRYVQTIGRPFRGYGVAAPDPVIGDAPPMRIAQSGGHGAIRQLIEEINNGTLIGFAAEIPDEKEGLAIDFLGRKITLATLVPRLMLKQGTSCFWWQALWRDDRICVEVEQLPEPQPEEAMDDWCRRWADAYLERVARIMRGPPENLNLRGIWANAD